jgi:hypothetical protein
MLHSEIIAVTARHLSDTNFEILRLYIVHCTFLQQTVVTRFGEGPKPPNFMVSKAFHFVITPCCLIVQCELLKVRVLQRNVLFFGKVKIQKCGEQIFQ